MKQIKTINELLVLIKTKNQVYHLVNGKMYMFDAILIFQTPLGELIELINENLLFSATI